MNPSPAGAILPGTPEGPQAVRPVVLVTGNPNSGKSTLFNALTGARSKVGNYPGVTVTRTTAVVELAGLGAVELVDLPGTYSLAARSRDEQVAVDAVLGRMGARPDAVLIVADATALGRALYLVGEILETSPRAVLALNMVDEARAQRLAIDHSMLAAELGIPVVPVVARSGEGLDVLRDALASVIAGQPLTPSPVTLPEATERDLALLEALVHRTLPALGPAARAWSLWALLSIDDAPPDELVGIPDDVRDAAHRLRAAAATAGRNLDLEIIGARYARVDNSQYRLLRKFTPGPFTFLLKATRETPKRLQNPRRRSIGIRVPDHPVPQLLLAELSAPIMSSTLLLPGDEVAMTDAHEIRERLEHQVDVVLDGGNCGVEPTTVIDLSGDAPVLVRQGRGDASAIFA